MAPSTRLGLRPERRVDYRHATTAARAGSIRNPIVVEEPPTPAPVVRSTKTKEKYVAKPARDAQGRFIKSERSIKPKTAGRNRVAKKTPPKPTEQARPEKTECVICASSKSTQRSFNAFNVEGTCAHFGNVCDHCIQTQIRTVMSVRLLTEAHLPCMFPECEAVLDHAALKKILSKALFETWDAAVTKHLLAADASYIACLNPKCGVYFSTGDCGSKSKAKSKQKEADADKAVCPYCDYEFCLSCNRLWHSGSCDSVKRREDKQSEKAIKKLGAKPCPKCSVNIEKQGGCDHMRCRNCRHDFCWECLGLFNGNANAHSDTCSHRRPMIAHDIGNFVGDNLTVAQVNGLIERARQDRDAGRVPQPNVQLMPGVQLVNGAAVVRPPRIPVPQPRPQAQGLDPQVRPRAPAVNAAHRRRRIVLREEDEADSNSEEEEQD